MTRSSFLSRLDALLQLATATELAFADTGAAAAPIGPPARRSANQSFRLAKAA
ncbi:MAG: hypothetical protein WCO00_09745 [Rhodospirillaceae bacterium]